MDSNALFCSLHAQVLGCSRAEDGLEVEKWYLSKKFVELKMKDA